MKLRFIFFAVAALTFASPAFAHRHHEYIEVQSDDTSSSDKKAKKEAREKWFKEAREIKHQFMIKELNLTKEQQSEFFRIYDKMEDEKNQVQRDSRKMEKHVRELGSSASDLEYEKAADAMFEAKQKEALIELKYKEDLKKVLTPKQLFMLKGAERKFTRELMDQKQKLGKKG